MCVVGSAAGLARAMTTTTVSPVFFSTCVQIKHGKQALKDACLDGIALGGLCQVHIVDRQDAIFDAQIALAMCGTVLHNALHIDPLCLAAQ